MIISLKKNNFIVMALSRRLIKMLIELAVLSLLFKLFHILGRKTAGSWWAKEFLDLDNLYPSVRLVLLKV